MRIPVGETINGCGLRRGAVPLLYNDPEHWRKRAEEARELAHKMTDPVGKSAMLEIAENYEQLAEQAEAIRKTDLSPIER